MEAALFQGVQEVQGLCTRGGSRGADYKKGGPGVLEKGFNLGGPLSEALPEFGEEGEELILRVQGEEGICLFGNLKVVMTLTNRDESVSIVTLTT